MEGTESCDGDGDGDGDDGESRGCTFETLRDEIDVFDGVA